MIRDSSFERIRDEVASDLRPVRPLRPGWTSALVFFPIAVLLMTLVLVGYGLRSDGDTLGFWELWGPAGLMVAAAYTLLVLALAQRSPGTTLAWGWWIGLPIVAIGLQIGGAYWTFLAAGPPPDVRWLDEAMCFGRIALLGLPPVLLALWMLSRGFPLRPRIVGLIAGIGGGLLGEGVYRLHCGMSHPSHIIPWHTGAVLVLGLLGLVAGLWWERHRQAEWDARDAA